MERWSDELKEQTRNTLYNMPPAVFGFAEKVGRKGACLKNLDGRYGYVTLDDCLKDRYPIKGHRTDEVLGDFKNLEDLLSAGWALD